MNGTTDIVERLESLFDAIAHGDAEHRAWLREAIDAHFAGKPVPPPRSNPSPEITSLRASRAAVIEECAKVADYEAQKARLALQGACDGATWNRAREATACGIAYAIRALKAEGSASKDRPEGKEQ